MGEHQVAAKYPEAIDWPSTSNEIVLVPIFRCFYIPELDYNLYSVQIQIPPLTKPYLCCKIQIICWKKYMAQLPIHLSFPKKRWLPMTVIIAVVIFVTNHWPYQYQLWPKVKVIGTTYDKGSLILSGLEYKWQVRFQNKIINGKKYTVIHEKSKYQIIQPESIELLLS
jgi:hypothetical protein